MDYTWLIGTTLFVGTVGGIVFFFNEYKEEIILWYTRLLSELAREDYIKEHKESIMKELCSSELTIYIDEELDRVHAQKQLLYEEQGQSYFWYLEKSHELALVKGHQMPFDRLFMGRLVRDFCVERLLLLSTLFKESTEPRRIVTAFIRLAKQPIVDRETRAQQRERLRKEEEEAKLCIEEQ